MPLPEKSDERSTDVASSKRSVTSGARGATGPRTTQGKQRSRYNAIKRGIFAKDVLLSHESAAEFESLIKGYREDFQPQGMHETLLVENLATIVWRRKRLLQAEAAEIASEFEFETLRSVQVQD